MCIADATMLLRFVAVLLMLLQANGVTSSCNVHNRGSSTATHLIVLAHGLMGSCTDLLYLSSLLEKDSSAVILRSKANEVTKSFGGIGVGGANLANEIKEVINEHPGLQSISFVGNSLGGMYSRYAAFLLFDEKSKKLSGLSPRYFMTIATPHLGVRDFTYFDDIGLPPPDSLKHLASRLLLRTGRDLFLTDCNRDANTYSDDCLVYRMATSEEFIQPLRSFKNRRLYANLHFDSVVPCGTAAILSKAECGRVRALYSTRYNEIHSYTDSARVIDSAEQSGSDALAAMIAGLNSLQWDKKLVSFRAFLGILPLSHNKLAALVKEPTWFFSLFNFNEGAFVMQDAADYLLS